MMLSFTSIDQDGLLVTSTSFLMKPHGFDGPIFRRASNLGDSYEIRERDSQVFQVTVNIYEDILNS